MTVATPSKISASGIELFRSGLQRDSSGRSKQWTVDDLSEMAASYNEIVGKHDAPILVGHDGNTAYGWLKKVWVDGGVLKGDLDHVDPTFAEAVNQRTYRKRSISIYPRDHADNPTPGKLNIRHLAYVGVPAVKGLADHDFHDSGKDFIEFEFGEFYGNAWEAIANLLEGMRDRMIDSDGLEAADEAFPKEWLTAIQREATRPFEFVSMAYFHAALDEVNQRIDWVKSLKQDSPYYSEFKESMNLKKWMADKKVTAVKGISPTDMQAILDGSMEPDDAQMQMIADALGVSVDELKGKKKTSDMSEPTTGYSELKAAVEALQAENKRLKDEQERSRVVNFVEGLIRDRKLLPANKQSTIDLALTIPHEVVMNYAEGDSTVSVTPRDRYLQTLASGKELWSNSKLPTDPQDAPEFSEPVSSDAGFDVESVKLDRKIRAKAKEMGLNPDRAADYAEAMNALSVTL